MSLINFKIPTTKAGGMSYLLMLVATGYRFWTRGEMHYSKAIGFANKINELYHVQATQSQRALLKKKGLAAVQLIMLPHDKDKTKIIFWLLATAGKGIINEREKLKDCLIHPIVFVDQYELTKIQRARAQGSKISWSWKMQTTYFKEQLAMSKSAADGGADAIQDYFSNIKHMPMFAGIREQVKQLLDNAQKTWDKRRKIAFPEVLPNPLPSMPKITVFGDLQLHDLVKKMTMQEDQRAKKAENEASAYLDDTL